MRKNRAILMLSLCLVVVLLIMSYRALKSKNILKDNEPSNIIYNVTNEENNTFFNEDNEDELNYYIPGNNNNNIEKFNMTNDEVNNLPSTNIIDKNITDENNIENDVEVEGFLEQGDISYDGTSEYPDVTLGDYIGLTYYSQLDSRWSSLAYTSVGNSSQTIASSGCGPTSAAMVVTGTKGTITPDKMSELFVKYGYRSANNGTYWSAFRWVADTFNIEYAETTNIDKAYQYLDNKHYIIVSCANGLFTTGGHYIVITGYDNGYIKIYDPYLYSGKFDTSTRRGKVIVNGNTVYITPENFRNFANYRSFFIYTHDDNVPTNNSNLIVTDPYTRYIKVSSSLNVRNSPNGAVVGKLENGTKVVVYETQGSWSRIGTNRWISSEYLTLTEQGNTSNLSIDAEVKVSSSLNVRNSPNGAVVGKLKNGTKVVVYETQDNWSKIGENRWVSSEYIELIEKPIVSSNLDIKAIVKVSSSLNIRKSPNGSIIGKLNNGDVVTIYEKQGTWSRIGNNMWVSSSYLTQVSTPSSSIGSYRVTASLLNVRDGPGANYGKKSYLELSANAREQNRKLGNYYANGYLKGVICSVTKITGNYGLTSSGWISLEYLQKIN